MLIIGHLAHPKKYYSAISMAENDSSRAKAILHDSVHKPTIICGMMLAKNQETKFVHERNYFIQELS